MTKSTRLKVAVALALAPSVLEELKECDVSTVSSLRAADGTLEASLADAEGLLVSSDISVDGWVMASAPKLRVISTMSVGLDHIDLEAASERGIVITNTPVLSDAVADLTIALMTMLSRRIPEAMDAVACGRWKVPLGGDLARKRLLLVGFGRIGQAVAIRALAMGMHVCCVDSRTDLPTFAGVERATGLAEALPDADFVSLHVDLNVKTRRMMGRAQFALMKPTAFFVNTSRGGTVDQSALTWAVTTGQIAGAGLDVLEIEPPLPDDPLLKAPNVIIVPHIGSATTETRNAMAQCAVDNLLQVLRREGSPFVVAPPPVA